MGPSVEQPHHGREINSEGKNRDGASLANGGLFEAALSQTQIKGKKKNFFYSFPN